MSESEVREELHGKLETAYPNVPIYFQPPGDMQLERPCIVYIDKTSRPSYGNNTVYVLGQAYQVSLLADLPGHFEKLPIFAIPGVVVTNNYSYIVNDVQHDVFELSVNAISL